MGAGERWINLICLFGAVLASPATHYAIPDDAIRIPTAELSAGPALGSAGWTEYLYRTLSDALAEEFDVWTQDQTPAALRKLTQVLEAAEQRWTSDARFVSVNRAGIFRGLLVVWLPVSFVLPTLGRNPYGYKRRRRSGDASEELNHIDYDPHSADYQFHLHYGPLLSRLDAYFSLLRIPAAEADCRPKLVCHVSRNADQCQPLSQLFRRLFERSQDYERPEFYRPALKRFFRLYWAHQKATRNQTDAPDAAQPATDFCSREYPHCSRSFDQMIRTDMLRFWQRLSHRFAIQLEDE